MPIMSVMSHANFESEEATMFHLVETRLNHLFQDRSDTALATMSSCKETSPKAQDPKSMKRWAVSSSVNRESEACSTRWPNCLGLRFLDACKLRARRSFFLVGIEMVGQSFSTCLVHRNRNRQLSARRTC